MKCLITVGPSASGKTQFAKEYIRNRGDWIIICRDDIRFPDGKKDWTNYKFNRKNENNVTKEWNRQLIDAANNKMNVIIADTSLNVSRRNNLEQWLEGLGYEVELKFFDEDIQTLIKRDRQREGGVGEHVIMRQWLQLHGEKYTKNSGINCILVDIDGTVARMNGRHPFEWDKVLDDLPVEHVINMVNGYAAQGYEVIFMSGRDGCCYDDTKEWLHQHFDFEFELFMRTAGDTRQDYIVKQELFYAHVNDLYKVHCVIDDRKQVWRHWIKLGLNVVAVGDFWDDF